MSSEGLSLDQYAQHNFLKMRYQGCIEKVVRQYLTLPPTSHASQIRADESMKPFCIHRMRGIFAVVSLQFGSQ
jgi:hypothetical protein